MQWILDRIVEPTTWLAVGVGAIILSMILPQAGPLFLIVAGCTVAAGIFMREKGKK
jgi:hypothetical protein|tara:strand:- start:2952 stop:3119 length:168 start_codon:yes stop_codon:yes gene_type:complete